MSAGFQGGGDYRTIFAMDMQLVFTGSGFRPDGRGTFSCVPKRKYPKRRAPGGRVGYRRCPAFLAVPGARITRQTLTGLPQTGCAPFSRNGCGTRRGLRDRGCLSTTRRRSRASQGKPGQARPCLSAASVSECASWASAGFAEKRRGPAQRANLRAAFLLGTFLWRRKGKSLARQGET